MLNVTQYGMSLLISSSRAGLLAATILLANMLFCGMHFAAFTAAQENSSEEQANIRPMIHPPLLKQGDTIMFVAPAGVLDRERMLLAKIRLEERGYQVKLREESFAVSGYLAGSDQRRAEELMQAFKDPEVQAIFPGTGGYGTMRILDLLDYEVIRRNPKLFIGFSDITALHAAFNRRAGLVTYHSPVTMWGLGSPEYLSEFSERYFFQAIDDCPDDQRAYTIEIPVEYLKSKAWGSGRARGRLTGGNLSLVAALLGTPYAIDTQDAILMIEDVGEAPYRIDRMLRQLKLAGKLDTLRGAVLGHFTDTELRQEDTVKDERYSAAGVLKQYFEPLGIPVLAHFPIGHHRINCTLPMGGEVEIDAERGTLRVLAR